MFTIEAIMQNARVYVRDFPRFFTSTVSKVDGSRTFELPHSNVTPVGLYVTATNGSINYTGTLNTVTGSAASEDGFLFALDERNGLLRIHTPPTGGFATGTYVNVEGYYFEWLSDKDLRYHALNIIAEHAYRRPTFNLSDVTDVEGDVIALGVAVDALWALLAEYARDIDISTPEAISVQATQRYRQVEDLLFNPNGLMARYREKAAMTNTGLNRIETIQIRRLSRTTNRLVPVYTSREWDDATYPERQFPTMDQPAPSTPPPDFVPARVVTGFHEHPAP